MSSFADIAHSKLSKKGSRSGGFSNEDGPTLRVGGPGDDPSPLEIRGALFINVGFSLATLIKSRRELMINTRQVHLFDKYVPDAVLQ